MATKPKQVLNPLANCGRGFRDSLISWFVAGGKDYPWRNTRDPYAILVSELMLQQTQIATVLEGGFYDRWMQRFPDTKTLAAAEEAEVLKCWEGLGYYSRARNLHAAARVIETDLKGRFPESPAEILHLPGVGPYTAGAVASFAFDAPAAIVDGNVARVFARVFDLRETVDSGAGSKQVWSLARQLMPRRRNANSREYNSALLELGQQICKRGSPRCGSCPVAKFCATRDPESLPRKKRRQKTVQTEEHVCFCLRDNCVLLEQERGTRRRGLWKLPGLGKESARETGMKLGDPILSLEYSITKYRVSMSVYQGMAVESTARQWVPLDGLDKIALGAPYRKALGELLQ